ncbi:hypothetical protein [Parafrankia sp. EUN1f]|uniref:hypothetical protein n=1 Tax=Parafrankia sp. EUN1f TaxID=102897 RepID=UPI0001C46D29|nr:hypothetical protein [Parafrankia sp. EUN1f]EFC80087.1 hypothetical protein FrEUN1fDRAFT_6814 [Parafrankia sp. EUN1f]
MSGDVKHTCLFITPIDDSEGRFVRELRALLTAVFPAGPPDRVDADVLHNAVQEVSALQHTAAAAEAEAAELKMAVEPDGRRRLEMAKRLAISAGRLVRIERDDARQRAKTAEQERDQLRAELADRRERLARLRGFTPSVGEPEVYAIAYESAVGDVLRRLYDLDVEPAPDLAPETRELSAALAAYRAAIGMPQRAFRPGGRVERAMTAALEAARKATSRAEGTPDV